MISSTRGSWQPRILSCTSRHSCRFRAPTPGGSKPWTTSRTCSTRAGSTPHLGGDLLYRGPEIAVFVQVADDHHPDVIAQLIQFGHPELPDEVGFQGGLLRIQGLKRQGFPLFVFAHGGRHEPILQEAVPIPFFRGGFGLAVSFGLLRQSIHPHWKNFPGLALPPPGPFLLFKLIVFQDRIGFQGLGNFPHQLHAGKLQQLDGLLQLLGHDEGLGKF